MDDFSPLSSLEALGNFDAASFERLADENAFRFFRMQIPQVSQLLYGRSRPLQAPIAIAAHSLSASTGTCY